NAAGRETRVALVENGHIAEFYLERKKDKGVVGHIYKGRVTRVLPGMQAAFVDIGLDKAAFLYVSDVFYDPEFSRTQFELTEGEHDETPEVPEEPGEGDDDAVAEGAEAAAAGDPSAAPTPPPPAQEAQPAERPSPPSPAADVSALPPGSEAPDAAALAAPQIEPMPATGAG